MKVPYEYFLRYLISLGYDLDSVNRSLETYGFDAVTENYIERLTAAMDIPKDFRPKSESHGLSMAWLNQQKIHSLWYRKNLKHINDAFDILAKPSIRKMVDTLTMAPIPYSSISNLLTKRFRYFVSPATIESYTLYFNNFSIMSPAEGDQYIRSRREYWKLAALNGDMELIRFHLGLDTQVASSKVIEDVLSIAYHKIREMRYMPNSLETAKSYGEYQRGVAWGIEERKTLGDNMDNILDAVTLKQSDLDDPVMEGEQVTGQLAGGDRGDK